MPRGPAPQWKRRLEPIMDDYLRASVDRANGIPHPDTGHYAELIYAGIESRERATEIKKALYRSGRYVKVSVSATVHPADDGTYLVRFKAIDKAQAKRYILEKYGTDRSKWPYDPRRKNADG